MRPEKAVFVVEGLPRHAIRAAEIAAVHDRDPQVAEGSSQRVAGGGAGAERDDDFSASHCESRYYHPKQGFTISLNGGAGRQDQLPAIETGNEAFGVGIGAWGKLDEPICSGQSRKVPGVVRRLRYGPRTAPVIQFDADWQVERERNCDREWGAKSDLLHRRD